LCKNTFNKFSKRTAINHNETGDIITYQEVEELICIVEQKLQSSKIQPGEHICSIAPLNIESVILAWACIRQGVVFVPIDHSWSAKLINHVVNEVDAKIIFCDVHLATEIDRKIIIYDEQPGFQTFSDWLDELEDNIPYDPPILNESDDAIILYTSGSTGDPKGVILSQGALFRSGILVTELFEWNHDDMFLNLGDLYAMSGFRNTCIAPLHVGCSIVISSNKSRESILLLPEVINCTNCTFIGTTPRIIRLLNITKNRFDPAFISSLRAVLCTGGFLDPQQVNLFYENFKIPVLNYYGLTETSGLCLGHSFSTFDPDEISIGKAVGATLQIVDIEDNPVLANTAGELRVKSNNLMTGYYNQPELTKHVMKNGWFYTGDIALKRSDGHIVLKGRSRNIIKNSMGDLIHCEEVELALENHPFVSDAGIIGISTELDDEQMIAFIVLKKNPDIIIPKFVINELKEYLGKTIGKRKIPHRFLFVEHLEKNTNGKLLRDKLKELASNEFSAQ